MHSVIGEKAATVEHVTQDKEAEAFFLGMTTHCHQWIYDSAPIECFKSSYDAGCSFHSSMDSGNTQGLE